MNEPKNSLYSGWCSNPWWLLAAESTNDRRQEPRIFVGEHISLTAGAADAASQAKLVNLSQSGALVLPDAPYQVGTVLEISYGLAQDRELRCAAVVRTCLHEQANGLAFIGLSVGDRCWVDNLVRRSTQGGLPGRPPMCDWSHAAESPQFAVHTEPSVRPSIYKRDQTWSSQPLTLTRRRIVA